MMDATRLSELFAGHAGALALYARQWLNRPAAEDVVQEAFVKLMLQPAEPGNAKAWLFTMVRNEAISHSRSAARSEGREKAVRREEWFDASLSDPIDAAMAGQALQTLPPFQREVIVLRIWGQLTLKAVATITHSSTSTVFDQYTAGLAALRQQMGVTCQKNR